MRLLTRLIQLTSASSCLHENKWKSQNPNLKYISEDPKKDTETFVGILKFYLFLCTAYHCHRVTSRTVWVFFQVIITCPWLAGLTPSQQCTHGYRQSVDSPLTAWLTPIQENTWISEGQLTSVRDALRQLLCTTLFLSLLRRVLVTRWVENVEHSLL